MKALLTGSVCLSYILAGFLLSLPYGFLTCAQTKREFIAMILLLPPAALSGFILLVMSYSKIGDVVMRLFVKIRRSDGALNLPADKATLSYVRKLFWVYAIWICLPILCNGLSIAAAWLNLERIKEFIFISRYSSLVLAMVAILAVAIIWNLIGEMIRAAKSRAWRLCQ